MNLPANVAAKADAARALLVAIAETHSPAVFTTSFGAEDMVLFDLIAGGERRRSQDQAQGHHDRDSRYRATARRNLSGMAGRGRSLSTQGFGVLSGCIRGRELCPHPWHQRVLRQRRRTQGLLPYQEGRAAQARVDWQVRVDYGTAPRTGGDARRTRGRGIRQRSRPDEIQSARRLVRRRNPGVSARPRRAGQCPARARLSEHRLRALHARRRAGRRCARGPVVVGSG